MSLYSSTTVRPSIYAVESKWCYKMSLIRPTPRNDQEQESMATFTKVPGTIRWVQ